MTERGDQQRPNSPLVSERGSTSVNDAVVAKLAGMAAGEVEGVRMGGSASRTAGGLLESVTGSQSQSRGVSVEVGRTEAAIDLTVGIEYGRDILEVVGRVRERIAERVQNLTGLQVTELNVTVSDIVFPDEGSDGEERRQGRGQERELESGDQPRARRTEELRDAGREHEDSEATTTDVTRGERSRTGEEATTSMAPGERSRAGDDEEVRVEGEPVDEDETRELRIGDEEMDETRRIPRDDDEETGRGGERRGDEGRRDG